MSKVPVPPVLSFPDTKKAFLYYCQKVLPAVYDDSLSYYELLCKAMQQLNQTLSDVDELNGDSQQLYEYVKALYESFDEFIESGFYDYYETMLETWIKNNMPCIVGNSVKFFSFGIDDTGHVFVDIPKTWAFLTMAWNLDYGSENFGKLEMEW